MSGDEPLKKNASVNRLSSMSAGAIRAGRANLHSGRVAVHDYCGGPYHQKRIAAVAVARPS